MEVRFVSRVCEEAGYHSNDDQSTSIQTLTIYARCILASLFVGGVAVEQPADAKAMYNCYLTYAILYHLKQLTPLEFKGFIEELLCKNLIGGATLQFGRVTRNYDTVCSL